MVSDKGGSVPAITAGSHGVKFDYGFDVVCITKVSEQMFSFTRPGSTRETRCYRDKLVAWGLGAAEAEKLCARLTSAKAEERRRQQAAQAAFREEQSRLCNTAMGCAQ